MSFTAVPRLLREFSIVEMDGNRGGKGASLGELAVITIFIIMREFHDFEKIQFRSSRPELHHRLGNWNLKMAITYSNFVQIGHMRCFLISTNL